MHKVIHFDAHLEYLITYKKKLILTVFGLVLDKSSSLSKQEISFFNKNINYYKTTLISNISFPIFNNYLRYNGIHLWRFKMPIVSAKK